jgi:AbrB family looped-hinge helix DNA binding protein
MLNETNSWVVHVDEDGVLTLPDEVWEYLGWREGDEVEFVDQEDGSFLLKKADETELAEGETDPEVGG